MGDRRLPVREQSKSVNAIDCKTLAPVREIAVHTTMIRFCLVLALIAAALGRETAHAQDFLSKEWVLNPSLSNVYLQTAKNNAVIETHQFTVLEGRVSYASTKGAINTLVKYFAAALGPRGIRVNAVAPGVIDTDMSNFTKTEAGRATVTGMQALKRIGQPGDVASVIAFLVSDEARWITGDIIAVDGGSKL
jgi:NAD(P)-dependent dehydrogenase (short-subunit alcohol dehydrogenase family)